MTPTTWLAFFAASWLISLSPGAGAISCLSAGMRYGLRRSIWNIAGMQSGALLLLAIVALGLGAVLAASTLAFEAIKWFGVAYLMWLGIMQWRAPAVPVDVDGATPPLAPLPMFVRGFLINASNPKAIIFMLAVLPQFIDTNRPQWPQYAICAATLVFTDSIVMSGYTLLAARVFSKLRDPRHLRALNRLFGSLFIGAAALLAGFRRST